jgi:hypothetical protein
MLKQKKLKTILILIIKISFNVNNNYVLYKKIEFMSTNMYKLQFYEYNNCKKIINKLKL